MEVRGRFQAKHTPQLNAPRRPRQLAVSRLCFHARTQVFADKGKRRGRSMNPGEQLQRQCVPPSPCRACCLLWHPALSAPTVTDVADAYNLLSSERPAARSRELEPMETQT